MEELFYNLRVGKIYNKNKRENERDTNDKFDYQNKKNKPQRFYMAKPNMNKANKLGGGLNVAIHVTKEGSIP